ncbi:MAG: hypothetical protein JO316_10110 [Abitibacteriaceae bacterium]|nr:hypothetical protein [Abditibacteriaceae bacterium]
MRGTGYEIMDYCYTPVSLDRDTTFKSKLGELPRTALYHLNPAPPGLAVRVLDGYSLLVLAG